MARVFTGQPGLWDGGYGRGQDSDGAKAIIRAVDRSDARPLWICVWGGANTLAEALMTVRATPVAEDVEKFVGEAAGVFDLGPGRCRAVDSARVSGLFYIVQPSTPTGANTTTRRGRGSAATSITAMARARTLRPSRMSGWMRIFAAKGRWGRCIRDSCSSWREIRLRFLGLIDNGLNAYRRPDWGGWGGRYVYRQPYGETHAIWTQGGDLFGRVTSQDTVMGVDGEDTSSDQATIWRWREAFPE